MGEADSITYAASEISKVLKNVKAVVTYTSSGRTTFLGSRERPDIPIVAVTPNIKVARQLGLVWGARRFINESTFQSFDRFEDVAKTVALASGAANKGDHIIITGGFPLGVKGRTNMLHTVYID